MTAKRFIFHSTEIEDTLETDVDYKYTSCNKDGFQDLCEMLNELAEENEQLKQNQSDLLEILNKELLKLDFDKKQGIERYPISMVEYIFNALKKVIE